MSKNITLMGASYSAVPAVQLPQTGGGTALFTDVSDTTAAAADVASGKYFYTAAGLRTEGTGTGGGGISTVTILAQQTITATDADSSGYYKWLDGIISESLIDDTNYIVTMDGNIYLCHANIIYGGSDIYAGDLNVIWGNPANAIYPFAMASYANNRSQWMVADNSAHTVKVEKVVSLSPSGTTLITKSISSNGTYNASDDDADGYSQVTVSVPNSYGAGDEGKVVSSGALVSQTARSSSITSNGTYDTTLNNSVTVAVSGGTSKNTQTAQSTTRRNNTSLGSIISLTCKTTGTYDVYWTCTRSNTSQTWGSQLYIGGSAYGTENQTWSNNVQNNHLTNVSISANDTVAVYGRSRSGYYIYAPQLTIVQTS